MSERHCPACTGEIDSFTDENEYVPEPCPGLPPCEACAALKQTGARLLHALGLQSDASLEDGIQACAEKNEEIARLLSWNESQRDEIRQKDDQIASLNRGEVAMREGILCGGCKDKDAEIAILRLRNDTQAESIRSLSDELVRLRALVSVGREMAEYLAGIGTSKAITVLCVTEHARDFVAKWRSLEGKG